jgi:hypothetical protein
MKMKMKNTQEMLNHIKYLRIANQLIDNNMVGILLNNGEKQYAY